MPKDSSFLDGFIHKSTIGRGNFGVVSVVKSKADKQRYVMKKIVFTGKTQEDRDTSMAEVALLKGLQHPNIVKYYGHHADKRNLYIVMELCEGGDLAKHIKAQGDTPFDEMTILSWFVQILMGLREVHEARILHRDLKTQNVFLTRNNVVKLGDFGIAKVLDGTLEQAATVVGTPFYMSPEACQNQPYTYSSDMWAVGCILYELCTRKHAFAANNLLGLVFQIVQGTYPPIEGYSPLMDSLVKGLLQTDPTQRLTWAQILKDPRIDIAALSEYTPKTKFRCLRKRSKKRRDASLDAVGAGAGAPVEAKSGETTGPRPLEQRLFFNDAEPVTTTALRMLYVVGSGLEKNARAGAFVSTIAVGKMNHIAKGNAAKAAASAAPTEKDVPAPSLKKLQAPAPRKAQAVAPPKQSKSHQRKPLDASTSSEVSDFDYSQNFSDDELEHLAAASAAVTSSGKARVVPSSSGTQSVESTHESKFVESKFESDIPEEDAAADDDDESKSDDEYSYVFDFEGTDDEDDEDRDRRDQAEHEKMLQLLMKVKDEAHIIDRIAEDMKMQGTASASSSHGAASGAKPIRSVHDTMMTKRQDLLDQFGKEKYLQLFVLKQVADRSCYR
eukprot:INCI10136.2.p1 GENE.INCI10136.2~~INCI10136.2.p1  ORF type:complete len:613 (-),score=140.26 INCI10136.2:3104-4942(-)